MSTAASRFKVVRGAEAAFQQVWPSRHPHLAGVPGIVEFPRMRRSVASYYVSRPGEDFEAWTRPEPVHPAHRGGGDRNSLYLARPRFDGFAVIQTVTPS